MGTVLTLSERIVRGREGVTADVHGWCQYGL